jgi:hypothetical protein
MVQPGVSALGKKKSTTGLPRNLLSATGSSFSSGRVKSGALSPICMGHYLYRKARRAATLALAGLLAITLALPLAGQRRRDAKPPRPPRAVAVLEVAGEAARLIPVFLLFEGRYHDAGLYRATPVPMSLEPGVVYEAERAGRSAGLFTVREARRAGRAWFGLGDWRPGPPPAPAPGEEDGPYRLGPGRDDDDDDGPPIIRRPGERPSAEDDPERPVIRRPAAPAAAPEDDPDRPILRRGRPVERAEAKKEAEAPLPEDAERDYLVAVSDAKPPPMHPFVYEYREGEEESMLRQMAALAQAEIAREATARGTPLQRLAGAKFQNVRLRAFDLDFNGTAELVFTAEMPLPAAGNMPQVTWHAAVIARVDREARPQKLWSQVTSTRRLDVAASPPPAAASAILYASVPTRSRPCAVPPCFPSACCLPSPPSPSRTSPRWRSRSTRWRATSTCWRAPAATSG